MAKFEEAKPVSVAVTPQGKVLEDLNYEVNRLTGRVIELEKELRQARADERRARAALYRASQGQA